MNAKKSKDLRRTAIIATMDAQAQAIAQLSDDIREAFAQHKAMIDKLIARVDALEARHE